MRVHHLHQRTPEWYRLRAGRIGGSEANVITGGLPKRGEATAARRDLLTQKALEQLSAFCAEIAAAAQAIRDVVDELKKTDTDAGLVAKNRP